MFILGCGSRSLQKRVFRPVYLHLVWVSQGWLWRLRLTLCRGGWRGRGGVDGFEDGRVPGGSTSGKMVMCTQRLRSPLWSQLGPGLSSSRCSASETPRRLLASPHRSERTRGKLSCSIRWKGTDTAAQDQIYLSKPFSKVKEFDSNMYSLSIL